LINLFDTGFLHVLFDPKARVPRDRTTGLHVIDRAQERIDHLVQTMSNRRDKIVIPAPALAEFLLLASDRRNEYLAILRRKAVFEIAGFDDPEAVELVEYSLRLSSKKLKARSPDTWAKLNYDRQMIAIAITRRVEAIYSMDSGIHSLAKRLGITSLDLIDLPVPPMVQMPLGIEGSSEELKLAVSAPSPMPPIESAGEDHPDSPTLPETGA